MSSTGADVSLLSKRQSGPTRLPGSGYSLFDSQLTVTGDIQTEGSVRIDGKMTGSIRQADTVVLGVGATMEGDVVAREVVIGGTLKGNIRATDRVELQPTAVVTGDIMTQVVSIQEGGVVNGRVHMYGTAAELSVPAASADHALPAGHR
jgi:cytoskeletal protein CcmA (bactofilin family)